MKILTKAQRIAKTKRDNARFAKLTGAQKRVAIAKDVLAQLAVGRIKAHSGTYFKAKVGNKTFKAEGEVQEALAKIPTCSACALGSLFVCTVEKADKLKLSDLSNDFVVEEWDDRGQIREKVASVDSDSMHTYLKGFFSLDQLFLIENAFEVSDINSRSEFEETSDSDFGASLVFNQKVEEKFGLWGDIDRSGADRREGDRIKMERIMRNIVRNRGRFVPTQNTK